VAEKAGDITSVGDNRAHSDERSEENKCGDVTLSIEGGGCSKKSLCNGGR